MQEEQQQREPVPFGEHPELGAPMTIQQVATRLRCSKSWIWHSTEALPPYHLDAQTMMLTPHRTGETRQGQQYFYWSSDVDLYEYIHPRPDKTKKAIPSFSEEDEQEILRLAQEQLQEKRHMTKGRGVYVSKSEIQRQMKKPSGFYTTIEYVIDKHRLPKSPKGRQYTYQWCEA